MNARVQTQEPTPTTLKRVGEHFTITLEGITGSMPLGEVEVSQTEGEEV